jgi:uncharacterized protein YutE (UPF0331/DUF86 family)
MIDVDTIAVRLDMIRKNVRLLSDIREVPFDKFVSDAWMFGGSQHYLQMAIQAVADICTHLLSVLQLQSPTTYRDAVAVLGDNGILSTSLANRLQSMMGLRNVLVHEYIDVDAERIYRLIQSELGDFEEFSREVIAFLKREGVA